MLLEQWSAPYPWGLLVVSDAAADFSGLPDQVDRTAAFDIGGDAIVFYVDNDALSAVAVRVWRDRAAAESGLSLVGSPSIAVPSGRLVVGDVERDPAASRIFDVEPGSYVLEAYFDRFIAAT